MLITNIRLFRTINTEHTLFHSNLETDLVFLSIYQFKYKEFYRNTIVTQIFNFKRHIYAYTKLYTKPNKYRQ